MNRWSCTELPVRSIRVKALFFVVLAALFPFTNLNVGTPLVASGKSDETSRRDVLRYGQRRLSFEINHGQTDHRVKFLAHGNGYTAFFTPTAALLALRIPSQRLAIEMEFVDANPRARIVGLDELPGKANYLLGSDPARWSTNISTYAKIRYDDLYPGVDLLYYGRQSQLEYDFVVSPGASPEVIRLAFGGAELELAPRQELVVRVGGQEVRITAPSIYQEVAGAQVPIQGGWTLLGSDQAGFTVASYDRGLPLVIDPVLAYSTYLGGMGFEEGAAIAIDSGGHAYITGQTTGVDFPTTPGAVQTAAPGGNTAFVTKLTPDGSGLVYSTYLGGTAIDSGAGIEVDSVGNAYVTGFTTSSDFPTTLGAFQVATGGSRDAFVAKLDPSGSTLLYSSYLGGSDQDDSADIQIDSVGNAYITGWTISADFPVTAGSVQTTLGGGQDAFVAKLDPTGTILLYATYLGGVDDPDIAGDAGLGIAIDAVGNAYVAGQTASTNFPTTAGAFDTVFGGGGDAFVTALNAAGSSFLYSTYLGGGNFDQGQAVAVDASGNAYITGPSQSTNFPTTAGAFRRTLRGGGDAFITKLNPTGSALVYSTYLGGNGFDYGAGIALDAAGNTYVAGQTESTNFPISLDAFQSTAGGGGDGFLTKLNAAGSALVYSSYLGGSSVDGAGDIALDASSGTSAYIVGATNSSDFPTTPGAFQTVFGIDFDVFVAKIIDTSAPPPPSGFAARVWIGLTNSDDVGIRFDLRAEVYRNSTELASSGVLSSAAGGSSGFNNANLHTIPLTAVPGVVLNPGDAISVTLLIRNACAGSGKNSGRGRLWYNDSAANSNVDPRVGSPTHYLRSAFTLNTAPGAGPRQSIDVAAGSKCSPYKPFGTWSGTLQ